MLCAGISVFLRSDLTLPAGSSRAVDQLKAALMDSLDSLMRGCQSRGLIRQSFPATLGRGRAADDADSACSNGLSDYPKEGSASARTIVTH